MLEIQIEHFWSWFIENSANLHSDEFDPSILRKLDSTITDWGLGWEIGPGLNKENSLAISPNGDRELLVQTFEIISKAPDLEDWEFYDSKQAKVNWNKVKFENIQIDASEWTYVLLQYPDNMFEILINGQNLGALAPSSRNLAIDLILTNLLGEKLKLEHLETFEFVTNIEEIGKDTLLKYLPVHLKKIVNGT